MKEALTFDDVLIVPKFSTVSSRKDVDLSFNDIGYPYISLPIISANMDTITGPEMARAMLLNGAQACLHRFCSIEDSVKMFRESCLYATGEGTKAPFVSIGLGNNELDRARALFDAGAYSFVIDVANGASMDVVKQVKALHGTIGNNAAIIVGNFASGQSVLDFISHCGPLMDGFKVGIGPGCFASGTRVLMSNGSYKNIEDIKIHDRVINKNGNSVEVIGVKFSGIRKVLSYKNNLFYDKTYVTSDHQHWVGDYSSIADIDQHSIAEVLSRPTKKGDSKLVWKPIAEHGSFTLLMAKDIKFDLPETFKINPDDFIESRRNMEGFLEFSKTEPSYDLGYVFGTFLGDGNARMGNYDRELPDGSIRKNTSGSTVWYFGKDELYIAEKLVRCIKNTLGTEAKIKETHSMQKVFNRNNHITRMFLEFGKKDKKKLPIKYFCSNREYLKGILDGLIDSDGTYTKDGRTGFSNTSKELIEQFGVIFYIINGYFPSSVRREPSIGGLKGCNIENCKPSYVSRSVNNPNHNDIEGFQINRLNSISEEHFLVPTYDIEVACNTHSFIANNAIVHNSACTTRIKTGIGYPQLSAIMEISNAIRETKIPIIADGGLKTPGDCAKALAAGASMLMSGSFFAGTDESPGDLVNSVGRKLEFLSDGMVQVDEWVSHPSNVRVFKKYRGSASKESYEAQGKDASWRTAEGESFLVPYKGPVKDVLADIEGGLRSAFSYVGAKTLKDFQEKAEFVRVTNAGYIEGTPHGKK